MTRLRPGIRRLYSILSKCNSPHSVERLTELSILLIFPPNPFFFLLFFAGYSQTLAKGLREGCCSYTKTTKGVDDYVKIRWEKHLVLAVVLLMAAGGTAVAEDAPWAAITDEEFTFVVGFAAGGSVDLTARITADALSALGIDVNVVNRPGSVGVEAAGWVAEQSPESNIMFWGVPMTLFFEPAKRDVGFTWEDFSPVASLGGATFCLGMAADAPWDDLDELLEWAKDNPGELTVGGQGELTQTHFTVALIFDGAGVEYVYVPFAGGADVQMNLAGGHVDVGHLSLAAAYPLYSAGELKIPAHTSIFVERVDMAPDVPNIAEYGFPDARESHIMFLWAPKGTSEDIINPLSEAIGVALQEPAIIQRLEDMGILVSYLDAEGTYELTQDIHSESIPAFVDWYENY